MGDVTVTIATQGRCSETVEVQVPACEVRYNEASMSAWRTLNMDAVEHITSADIHQRQVRAPNTHRPRTSFTIAKVMTRNDDFPVIRDHFCNTKTRPEDNNTDICP